MIIIGIDPSLTSTGICIMEKSGKLLSTLAINSGFSGMKRLHDIKEQLSQEMNRYPRFKVTVFIESYSFGSQNGREALGELGGMIRLILYEEGIEFVDVAPTSLKKYATGIGKGDKVAMAIGVIKTWGVDFPTTDQTDAYALCQFGRGYLGLVDDLTVFRKEVIDAIKNPKVKKRAKK
jgi:crossover junction endodeoxyribonuclease RuvC